jgi:hypothetical protein
VPEDLVKRCKPHGLRVAGWVRTRDVVGRELAKAHGGWHSSACSRYDRWKLASVHAIPAAIAGLSDPRWAPTAGRDGASVLDSDDERPIPRGGRSARRARIARMAASASSSLDIVASAPAAGGSPLLPPGWVRLDRVSRTGRKYAMYAGPHGQQVPSRPAAWRMFEAEEHSADDDGPSSADGAAPESCADGAAPAVASLADMSDLKVGTPSQEFREGRGRFHYHVWEDEACDRHFDCTFPRGHEGLCSIWFPAGPRRAL